MGGKRPLDLPAAATASVLTRLPPVSCSFIPAHYIEWGFTTPALLYILSHITDRRTKDLTHLFIMDGLIKRENACIAFGLSCCCLVVGPPASSSPTRSLWHPGPDQDAVERQRFLRSVW